MNLLQNGIRHTSAGGAIAVVARARGGVRGRPAEVLVQVVDTGEGIAPGDLPHIFEPTFRGEASRARTDGVCGSAGAGLGLAIARGIVAAHGGAMWADSPVPTETREAIAALADGVPLPHHARGAVVSFTLPAER
jgi:two-component system sensor histidine kinase BaeS